MDDEVLIDEAAELLPRVNKLMHACVSVHPFVAGRSYAQKRTLMELYHSGGRTVGELAQAIPLSMPAASEMIDRLVEDGIVARTVNPADRRQVIVELTPGAREIGDEIHANHVAQVRAGMERLAPEERPVFVRSLRAFAEALEESAVALQHTGCPAHAVAR